MAEALDDAWAKWERAGEHLDDLRAEVAKFTKGRPYKVTGATDLKSGEYVLRIKPGKPSKRIGTLIGDVLSNLRPPLNYLVKELAVLDSGKASGSNQFPICDTPELFKRALNRGRLAGLSDDHVALIEKLQPYPRRNAKKWLRLLRDYSNPDKHENLNVLLSHIEGDFNLPTPTVRPFRLTTSPEVNINSLNINSLSLDESGAIKISSVPATPIAAEPLLFSSQPITLSQPQASLAFLSGNLLPAVSFDPNVRIAAAQTEEPPQQRNVHVELRVTVGVAFPEGAGVVETMEILESQVAKTLNAFEPLFD